MGEKAAEFELFIANIIIGVLLLLRGKKKKNNKGGIKTFHWKIHPGFVPPTSLRRKEIFIKKWVKNLFVEYCFLGAGVGCHMAPGWILDFLGFFCRMIKERNKQRSCGCSRTLGCALVLPHPQAACSCEHPGAFSRGLCVLRVFPKAPKLPEIPESFLL